MTEKGRPEGSDVRPRQDLKARPRYRAINAVNLQRSIGDRVKQLDLDAIRAVATVLPFRTNGYVVDELIDWSNIPEDPIFQLTFPQPGMLDPQDYKLMRRLIATDAPRQTIVSAARGIQDRLNPHPAGQREFNIPIYEDEQLPGVQHKYRETVLFFPAAGQTCHAYCTYCFRWAQFVGIDEMKFASNEPQRLADYLRSKPDVRSVLITGGDPLVMKSHVLRRYIEPLLGPGLDHIESIRLGTKAPAYWPQRFVTDEDADDLLRLIQSVRAAGKHLALMAHYSHPRELETRIAEQAVERIQSAGATIRCQSPLIKHVNDSSGTWIDLWTRQVNLGAVPYYMFVERDTGPKQYFEVPLARALPIFNGAYRKVSGLGRTVRGPSMSTTPGKVVVDGVATINGRKVFVLKFIQARDPEWVGKPFFAEYDRQATWLTDLRPAFNESRFFFEPVINDGPSVDRGAPVDVVPSP